ncbi:MAG: glycosyltransferase family 4 protein [Gemmatimonadaceae bacterium]
MKILFLCEGDAETPRAFSGAARSVVQHLRAAGDDVVCGDCDVKGLARYAAALPMFSPNKRRWVSRYHTGGWPFVLRTRRAREVFDELGRGADVILQIGATFQTPGPERIPRFMYCDSNIRAAERGRATGYSWASPLSSKEIDAIAAREEKVYRSINTIFTISEYLRQVFITDFAQSPDKVVAAGGGANLDVGRIAARKAVPPDPPTILFVGVDFQRKGGELLLRSFERVRERIPSARLIIVGPRDVQISQDGVENLGFLNKDVPADLERLERAYASSHVFCLPTRFEPFGIAYIEAMLYGLPCVGPRAWAIPEMIFDGETGHTVQPENAEEMTNRLLQLLENPAQAFQMGQAGRRRAEATFRWESVVARMRTVMQRTLGSG